MVVDALFVAAGGAAVAELPGTVEQPAPLRRKMLARLASDARLAVRNQRAAAAAIDRGALQLFALSASLISASALLGQLELARSNVGLLSWVAIVVTVLAWTAGALAAQLRARRLQAMGEVS